MSEENVEIVRRCYESWSKRDLSFIREVADPDIEVDLSRNVFNPDTYRGHQGVELLMSVVADVWDDFRLDPTELIDAGDHVVAAITVSGKGKESGVPTEMSVFNIWTFRGDKVVRMVGGYRSRAEALEAAGLRE
jgi:ketosteroid isomerase-like protein